MSTTNTDSENNLPNREIYNFVQLECGIQNYEWGKIGRESFVYNLVMEGNMPNSLNLNPNMTYAEVWMGTHVNSPSYALIPDKKRIRLSELIDQNRKLYLGDQDRHCKENEYNEYLPFLFKVLSINKMLSIQAHPDKKLAEKLHAKFPLIYKDDNHKPEISIAITKCQGLCNFGSKSKIL